MPQLDKVTFFSQVTWSLLTYLFLYFLFSVHVGPAIGRVLKVRSKINLGGTAASGQPVSDFVLAVSPIFVVSSQSSALFLKAHSVSAKSATSAVVDSLRQSL